VTAQCAYSSVVVSRGHLVAGVTITAAAEAGMQFGVRAPIWTLAVQLIKGRTSHE